MNVLRAITEIDSPTSRRALWCALSAASAVVWVSLALVIIVSLSQLKGGTSNAAWEKHRAEIRALPDELYRRDRFRAIRGRVADSEGKPVSGALVRCVRIESLVELAKAGMPNASRWTVPIEAEVTTDSAGNYEFPHLPVGARTFFYSAPGPELAPVIKDLVVVQDGLGAQLNVTLERPAVLRVKIEAAPVRTVLMSGAGRSPGPSKPPAPSRLHLIPQRWWPVLVTADVPQGQTSVKFQGLGGPLRKGLIAASGPDDSARLQVLGRYDLDESAEAVVTDAKTTVSQYDLPEAAGIEPWGFPTRISQRLFYAAMSPIALFWPVIGDNQPPRWTEPSYTLSPIVLRLPAGGTGTVRGFAPHPFLPVLVESRSGGSWLVWTSDASEFEVSGLPAGSFRVRALDLFGRVTFAAGASVRDGSTMAPARLWAKVDLDEPDSREVMGFVRWESGIPAEKAVVFMQNSYSFRKFLRRAETDEQGFFRFSDVPGDEPYFIFALPPGDDDAMRAPEYFGVAAPQREVWRTLTLHPHSVTGSAPANSSGKAPLRLVLIGRDGERPVWSFKAAEGGRFAVANVPHGRYRIHVDSGEGGVLARSLPFDVGDKPSQTAVRWSLP